MNRNVNAYVTATEVAAAVFRRHCLEGVAEGSAFAAAVETYRRLAPRTSRRDAARTIASGLWSGRAAVEGPEFSLEGPPLLPS